MPLTNLLPFVVYWTGILLLWSLIVGPICFAVAKRRAPLHVRHPAWYSVGFLVVLIVGAILFMGAVFTPLLVILGYWIFCLVRDIRQPNIVWRTVNLVLLGALFAAVPISYARPRFFDARRPQHETPQNTSSPLPPKAATQTPGQ